MLRVLILNESSRLMISNYLNRWINAGCAFDSFPSILHGDRKVPIAREIPNSDLED